MSYPALSSLSINRPHEISSYTLSSNNDIDILSIKYIRQKGSLLPTTKKFRFPRRPMPGTKSLSGGNLMTEISPALEAALIELSSLLSKKTNISDRKKLLLSELDEFESYIKLQIAGFKSEIERIDSDD